MKKFTFIFLFYNIKDETLQATFNDSILANLLEAKYRDNINVIIADTVFSNLSGSTKRTFETMLHELKPDLSKTSWIKDPGSPAINFGNINIADKDVLGLVLLYIKLYYPAEDYVLYTNNHSNQFGALDYDQIIFDKNQKYSQLFPEEINIKHIYEPNENVDMLSYYELSKAVEKGFLLNQFNNEKDRKYGLSLLINIGCYSATLDNLFHFSQSGLKSKSLIKYYCASESRIANYFIDARAIINLISENGIENGLELLFYGLKQIKDDVGLETERIKSTMFTCFKLSDSKELTEFFESIGNIIDRIIQDESINPLLKNIYTNTNDIANIRYFKSEGDDLKYKYSVDLYCFLEFLFNNSSYKKEVLNLKESYKKIIIFENCNDYSGVSCFIPPPELKTITDASEIYNSMKKAYFNDVSINNTFTKKIKWRELLKLILKE